MKLDCLKWHNSDSQHVGGLSRGQEVFGGIGEWQNTIFSQEHCVTMKKEKWKGNDEPNDEVSLQLCQGILQLQAFV